MCVCGSVCTTVKTDRWSKVLEQNRLTAGKKKPLKRAKTASQQPEAQRKEMRKNQELCSWVSVYLKNKKRLENFWPVKTFTCTQLLLNWCRLSVLQTEPVTSAWRKKRSIRCCVCLLVLVELSCICSRSECRFCSDDPEVGRESSRIMIMLQKYPGGCFYSTAVGPINPHQAIIFLLWAPHTVFGAVSGEPASASITKKEKSGVEKSCSSHNINALRNTINPPLFPVFSVSLCFFLFISHWSAEM